MDPRMWMIPTRTRGSRTWCGALTFLLVAAGILGCAAPPKKTLPNEVWRKKVYRAQPAEGIELGTSESIYAPPREQEWREAWSITEQLLLRMRDISIAEGSKFVVVTVPTSIQVPPDSNRRIAFERRMKLSDVFYPDRRIADLGEQHGFAVITPGERMQEIAEARKIYFHGFENTVLGKGHLNSEGHRVLSNILAEGLCKDEVFNAVTE